MSNASVQGAAGQNVPSNVSVCVSLESEGGGEGLGRKQVLGWGGMQMLCCEARLCLCPKDQHLATGVQHPCALMCCALLRHTRVFDQC